MTSTLRPVRWVLFFACLFALAHDWGRPIPVNALPSGGQVAGGAATIQQPNAQTLNIQQSTDRALLNWQGFSIGSKETVQFFQPSVSSLAVNRILGGDPSMILGHLLANGRVFLLNPNGVVFGPGSVVNVGGLLASTLSLQSYDLGAGRFSFAQDPTKSLAAVVNQGTLRAADHGFVVLAAPGVVNDGLIVAKFGQVGLGAGTQMTVDFRGDGLIQYAVDGKVLSQVTDPSGRPLASAVSNTGRIEADGGTVQSGNGAITIFGTGGNGDGGGNVGVALLNGAVVKTALTLGLDGQGGDGAAGTGNVGVVVDNSTVQTTGSFGPITVNGTGGTGASGNEGVRIANNGLVTVVDSSLSITGTGGTSTGSGNRGVALVSGAQVTSTGSGTIGITGTGATGTDFNQGVAMGQGTTKVTSAGGAISITGTGGGSAPGIANYGVLITNGAQVEGTGSAAVTITGTGGLGTFTNGFSGETGLYLAAGAPVPFVVRTANGDLTLIGIGGGTLGVGTVLRAGAVVEATGSGSAHIDGAGSLTGIGYNHGVLITEAGTIVRANTGNLEIGLGTGGAIGGGTGNNNMGVGISAGALVTVLGGTSAITITGTGGGGGSGANNVGVVLLGAPTQILANGGSITITGTGMNGAPNVFAGSGFVVGAPGIPCPGGCANSPNLNAGAGTITIP